MPISGEKEPLPFTALIWAIFALREKMAAKIPGHTSALSIQLDSAGYERGKGTGQGPHVLLQAGSLRELLGRAAPLAVKQEQGEVAQQCWEVQWKEFLRTMESTCSEWRTPEILGPSDGTKACLAHFEGAAGAAEGLTKLLSGLNSGIQQTESHLLEKDKVCCVKVKEEILDEESSDMETRRQCFRQFSYQEAEGPRAVLSRLWELGRQWLKPERCTKEQILEQVILEQFLTILPQEMQGWVSRGGPESCSEVVALAEDFLLRQQEIKLEESQVSGLLKDEGVYFSKSEKTPLDSWQRPTFKEIKQEDDRGAVSLTDDNNKCGKENHHPENFRELRWILSENVGQLVSQCPNEGRAPESCQGNCPQKAENRLSPEDDGLDENVIQKIIIKDEEEEVHGEVFRWKHDLMLPEGTHTGSKLYECSDCGKSFSRRAHLIRHQRIHTGEKPYKCTDCGKSFNCSSRLITHKRKHTGQKPYICTDCGKSFSSRSNFIVHRKIHTGEKPYQCLYCGKSFGRTSHLIRHQSIHTGEKPYHCSDCGKCFSRGPQLIAHKRTHTGEKPYKCTDCGKSFRNQSTFIVHKRIHTGEKPYKCSDCERSFSRRAHLIRHERTHTGEKPYICADCGKSFSDCSNLIVHRRIHTGEKLYKCNACGKSFRHRSHLSRHQRTHT